MAKPSLVHYETMFLFAPELAETAVKKEVELLKQRISKIAGVENAITFEEFWGKRDLEYPIEKRTSGFYVVLQYNFPTQSVRSFDEELRLDSNVLRHLTIKVPAEEKSPITYKEVMAEYEEFVDEKVAGKRKVRKISNRKETLDIKKK